MCTCRLLCTECDGRAPACDVRTSLCAEPPIPGCSVGPCLQGHEHPDGPAHVEGTRAHVGPWAADHKTLARVQTQVQPCPRRAEKRGEQSSGRRGVGHVETHVGACQCRDPLRRDTLEPGSAPAVGRATGQRGSEVGERMHFHLQRPSFTGMQNLLNI